MGLIRVAYIFFSYKNTSFNLNVYKNMLLRCETGVGQRGKDLTVNRTTNKFKIMVNFEIVQHKQK